MLKHQNEALGFDTSVGDRVANSINSLYFARFYPLFPCMVFIKAVNQLNIKLLCVNLALLWLHQPRTN